MCDASDHHPPAQYGFLVDAVEIRALIAETERVIHAVKSDAERVEALRPAFASLLATDGWLPEACAKPDAASRMGGGIGQYALYRAENGSVLLFSSVVPGGAAARA